MRTGCDGAAAAASVHAEKTAAGSLTSHPSLGGIPSILSRSESRVKPVSKYKRVLPQVLRMFRLTSLKWQDRVENLEPPFEVAGCRPDGLVT